MITRLLALAEQKWTFDRRASGFSHPMIDKDSQRIARLAHYQAYDSRASLVTPMCLRRAVS